MARFSPGLQNAINNLMSGHGTPLRLNPAGRTIEARRSGTCPISGEPISPGDSITKTDAGWVLSQHAGAAMENPLRVPRSRIPAGPMKPGKGKYKQTPDSIANRKEYYDAVGTAMHFDYDPQMMAEAAMWREPKRYAEVDPGFGQRDTKGARQSARALKEKRLALKAASTAGKYGLSNPATPSSGPSASSLIRKAKDHDLFGVPRSPTKVDFHSDSGYDGMGGAYIGSVSVNGDIVTFVGFEPPGKSFAVKILNPRKATAAIVDVADALNAGYDDLAATVTEFADGVLQLVGESGLSNPYFENGMGGSAMKYAKKHRVSLKQGWAAVKAGRS